MRIQKIVLFISFLIGTSLYSQKQFIFFGSYNWEKGSEAVYVYELDTVNGKLTKVASSSDVINPGYITISPDGNYVYASSDAKKQITAATSSGLAIRPSGYSEAISFFVCTASSAAASCASKSGVSTSPGQTALTRMPYGPNSSASALVNVFSAPLAAQ